MFYSIKTIDKIQHPTSINKIILKVVVWDREEDTVYYEFITLEEAEDFKRVVFSCEGIDIPE